MAINFSLSPPPLFFNPQHIRRHGSVETAYRTHLTAAAGFYQYLVYRLQREFNLKLAGVIDYYQLPEPRTGTLLAFLRNFQYQCVLADLYSVSLVPCFLVSENISISVSLEMFTVFHSYFVFLPQKFSVSMYPCKCLQCFKVTLVCFLASEIFNIIVSLQMFTLFQSYFVSCLRNFQYQCILCKFLQCFTFWNWLFRIYQLYRAHPCFLGSSHNFRT